ncbi:hypothetical protein F5Y09DRAFT_323258 [Xylaria sp. FL1042]|nr:hypothetical protein F5Y09DRAFT_323258 [Xylaria sp. FL1042]
MSQDSHQPIIAVSINYRVGLFGFLQTLQVLAESSSNTGLLDQRPALECPSALEKTDSFIKPLLLGSNSDEGISFGPRASSTPSPSTIRYSL